MVLNRLFQASAIVSLWTSGFCLQTHDSPALWPSLPLRPLGGSFAVLSQREDAGALPAVSALPVGLQGSIPDTSKPREPTWPPNMCPCLDPRLNRAWPPLFIDAITTKAPVETTTPQPPATSAAPASFPRKRSADAQSKKQKYQTPVIIGSAAVGALVLCGGIAVTIWNVRQRRHLPPDALDAYTAEEMDHFKIPTVDNSHHRGSEPTIVQVTEEMYT